MCKCFLTTSTRHEGKDFTVSKCCVYFSGCPVYKTWYRNVSVFKSKQRFNQKHTMKNIWTDRTQSFDASWESCTKQTGRCVQISIAFHEWTSASDLLLFSVGPETDSTQVCERRVSERNTLTAFVQTIGSLFQLGYDRNQQVQLSSSWSFITSNLNIVSD